MRALLLTPLLLAGCATTPEVTTLLGPRYLNNGDQDVALTIMLIQRFGQHGVTGCVHTSEPTHGGPFRNDPEDTSDTCGLGLRWGGK
jgi:hypothetical protein